MGDLSPHFSRVEFQCRCGDCANDMAVDAELIRILEEMRNHFGGLPVHILSGYRCKAHNKRIGGAEDSQHPKCRAADFVVRTISSNLVQAYLKNRYPKRYGIGSYSNFTHVDSRSTKARWIG